MKKILLSMLALTALPALAAYEVNYPEGTTVNADRGRYVISVGLDDQAVSVDQNLDHLLYYDLTANTLTAKSGQEVKPALNWNGTWMHGYLYIDLNQDGQFDPATELISYSYLNGKNSLQATAAQDCGVGLPPFVAPGRAGDYRMRYVVDWNWSDPGGRNTATNDIVGTGGAIVDCTLRIEAADNVEDKYAIALPANTESDYSGRHVQSITLATKMLGTQAVEVNQQDDKLLYHDCTAQEVIGKCGEEITLGIEGWVNWMNVYVYLDRAGNGDFGWQISTAGTPLPGSDLLGFSNLNNINSLGAEIKEGNSHDVPAFRLPAELTPGKYRMRVKVDWDNADPAGSEKIAELGGSITDFTLVIPEELQTVSVRTEAMNGILLAADGSPLQEQLVAGVSTLTVKALPTLPGFAADHITAICGDVSTDIALDEEGLATIPAELIAGDIIVKVNFEEQEDSEWTTLWADEFDSTALNEEFWSYDTRSGATWKRYVANTDEGKAAVNRFEDGYYSSWCVATPDEMAEAEGSEMISGAIMTRNKVDVLYGKVEARVKTTPHTGNFPAFWMMPTQSPYGWPKDGEIDIWEQIDAQDAAHHTVHSGWTGWKNYCGWETGPQQGSPQSTSNEWVDAAAWHVFAIEWTEDEIKWFTDGVERFSYKNMHYSESAGTYADEDKTSNYTEDITWPFSHRFYIILNQSVGNGTWAKNRDLDFAYNTLFDYVRVYQKKVEAPDEPEPVEPDPVEDGISSINSDKPAALYDLQGRRVINPGHGIYIQNGKKIRK